MFVVCFVFCVLCICCALCFVLWLSRLHNRRYEDGGKYEGDWKRDRIHGFGRRDLPNGCWFEGNWVNGVKHGRLTLHYPNGDRREGAWADGFLRRWLCDRISSLTTIAFIEYFHEDEANFKGIVAQNAVKRFQLTKGRENCERVPRGVDPGL